MRFGVLTVGLALGVLAMLLPPAGSSQASAFFQLTDRYEGTQEAGGLVTVIVLADPPQIVGFEVDGIAGGGCSWDTITLANWGGPIDIVDDHFAVTNPDGDVLEGAWVSRLPADTRIEGTISVRDPIKGCETPPLRWVVTLIDAPDLPSHPLPSN